MRTRSRAIGRSVSVEPLARFSGCITAFSTSIRKKPSKSLGNFFTIREILEEFDAAALRHYFCASHYRSPMDFSKEGLSEAARATDRIYETIEPTRSFGDRPGTRCLIRRCSNPFRREMDDDFNTPRALALIFDEVRALNRLLDEKDPKESKIEAPRFVQCVIYSGLLRDGYSERKKQRFLKGNLTAVRIEESIGRRDRARLEKNWQERQIGSVTGRPRRHRARRYCQRAPCGRSSDEQKTLLSAPFDLRRWLRRLGHLWHWLRARKICRARTRRPG